MAFSMFSSQVSPIAVNFGASSVKLLQVAIAERPLLVAAAEIEAPVEMRGDFDRCLQHYGQEIPKLLKSGKFRGKRAITAVPTAQTLVQHMQIAPISGTKIDDLIKAQLQMSHGINPAGVVVRSVEACDRPTAQQPTKEMICFAVGRETVMRYVDTLKRCRLDVVGVHTETLSMTRAYRHLCRDKDDQQLVTMFIDMGWSGTRMAVCHGNDVKFSRFSQIGGKYFDQVISRLLNCDPLAAHQQRLAIAEQCADALQSSGSSRHEGGGRDGMALLNTALVKQQEDSGDQPHTSGLARSGPDPAAAATVADAVGMITFASTTGNVDLTEIIQTVADELAMCTRYHNGLFPDRPIDRVVFLGGESRQTWICQTVAAALQLPAFLGDPLSRLQMTDETQLPNTINVNAPRPGWAVPCGLCLAPTDL